MANAVELLRKIGRLKKLLVVGLSSYAFRVNCYALVGLGIIDEYAATGSQCSHFLALERHEHGDKLGQYLLDDLQRHVCRVCSVEDEHKSHILRKVHQVMHGDEVGAYFWLQEGSSWVDETSSIFELMQIWHLISGNASPACDFSEGVLVIISVGD